MNHVIVLSRCVTLFAPDLAIKTVPIKGSGCSVSIYSARGLGTATGELMRSEWLPGQVGDGVPETAVMVPHCTPIGLYGGREWQRAGGKTADEAKNNTTREIADYRGGEHQVKVE